MSAECGQVVFGREPFQLKMEQVQRRATLGVSNLAGPAAGVRLCGAGVDSIRFWVLPGSMPCMITILSYAGRLVVCTLADAAALTHPDALNHFLREELLAVLAAGPP